MKQLGTTLNQADVSSVSSVVVESYKVAALGMSGRPKRAAALLATKAIQGGVKSGRYEAKDVKESKEELRPKRSRRTNAAESTASMRRALPDLPADIWGLIMCFMYERSTDLKDYMELRTINKAWAATSSCHNQGFWRRLSERFLGTESTINLQNIVREHYDDSWIKFCRYCFGSTLALPSQRGNPGRTGYVAPFTAPKHPRARWMFDHEDKEANEKIIIVPSTFRSWGDRVVFMTRDTTVICLNVASGEKIWSHKVLSKAENKDLNLASEFSLEIRVTPSAQVAPDAPHLDLFVARSVVCLCHHNTLVSLQFETGQVEWSLDSTKDLGGVEFTGGIVVLPHGCISMIRELKAPHEIFGIMFGAASEDVKMKSPQVLWKTPLGMPGYEGMSVPAADLLSGLCLLPVGREHGQSKVEFVPLRVDDGAVVHPLPEKQQDDEDEMWGLDIRYGFGGEDVVMLAGRPGEETHVEARNVFDAVRKRIPKNEMDDEDEDEESEEHDESERESESKSDMQYEAEFSDDFCLDTKRNRVLLHAGYGGGGSGWKSELWCVDRETRKPLWRVRDPATSYDGVPSEWTDFLATCKRPDEVSIYTSTTTGPLCDSEGSSVWPIRNVGTGVMRILVVDVNGKPVLFTGLKYLDDDDSEQKDDDEESSKDEFNLELWPEDDDPSICSISVQLARVNGKHWILMCSTDWIWAACD